MNEPAACLLSPRHPPIAFRAASVPLELTERLVELLLFSMSSGYGATELLRNMQLSDSEDGVIVRGVPDEAGRRIWLDILQRAVPNDS